MNTSIDEVVQGADSEVELRQDYRAELLGKDDIAVVLITTEGDDQEIEDIMITYVAVQQLVPNTKSSKNLLASSAVMVIFTTLEVLSKTTRRKKLKWKKVQRDQIKIKGKKTSPQLYLPMPWAKNLYL